MRMFEYASSTAMAMAMAMTTACNHSEKHVLLAQWVGAHSTMRAERARLPSAEEGRCRQEIYF
jgi:hypothetical protein